MLCNIVQYHNSEVDIGTIPGASILFLPSPPPHPPFLSYCPLLKSPFPLCSLTKSSSSALMSLASSTPVASSQCCPPDPLSSYWAILFGFHHKLPGVWRIFTIKEYVPREQGSFFPLFFIFYLIVLKHIKFIIFAIFKCVVQ